MAASAKRKFSSRSVASKSRSHGKGESKSTSKSSSRSGRSAGASSSKSASRSKTNPGTVEMICKPVRTARAAASRGGSRGESKRSDKGREQSSGRSRARGKVEGAGQTTTDHEQIRQWVEERGGKPACVRGTGGKGDTGMLRIDMPGYTGAGKLAPISWDDWFEKFEEKDLAFLYQDELKSGRKSNFNKLVSRNGGK